MKIFQLQKQGMEVAIDGTLINAIVNYKKSVNTKKIFIYKSFDFSINLNINNNLFKLCSTKFNQKKNLNTYPGNK